MRSYAQPSLSKVLRAILDLEHERIDAERLRERTEHYRAQLAEQERTAESLRRSGMVVK